MITKDQLMKDVQKSVQEMRRHYPTVVLEQVIPNGPRTVRLIAVKQSIKEKHGDR